MAASGVDWHPAMSVPVHMPGVAGGCCCSWLNNTTFKAYGTHMAFQRHALGTAAAACPAAVGRPCKPVQECAAAGSPGYIREHSRQYSGTHSTMPTYTRTGGLAEGGTAAMAATGALDRTLLHDQRSCRPATATSASPTGPHTGTAHQTGPAWLVHLAAQQARLRSTQPPSCGKHRVPPSQQHTGLLLRTAVPQCCSHTHPPPLCHSPWQYVWLAAHAGAARMVQS